MAEDQVQDQQPDNAPEADNGVEKEARLFGWVPKEEFRGSETDWVDADTFVKRGKEINPILRKNNELLMKRLDEQAKQLESLKSDTEEWKKFQKDAFDRKQTELQAQIAELKAAVLEPGSMFVDDDAKNTNKARQRSRAEGLKLKVRRYGKSRSVVDEEAKGVVGGYLFPATAIGIVIGSYLAGKSSKSFINLGLSSISCGLISLFFILLPCVSFSLTLTVICLILIGFCGGIWYFTQVKYGQFFDRAFFCQ